MKLIQKYQDAGKIRKSNKEQLQKGWSKFGQDLKTFYKILSEDFPEYINKKGKEAAQYIMANGPAKASKEQIENWFTEDSKIQSKTNTVMIPEWLATVNPVGYGVKVPREILNWKKISLWRPRLTKSLQRTFKNPQKVMSQSFNPEVWADPYRLRWNHRIDLGKQFEPPYLKRSQQFDIFDPQGAFMINRFMLENPTFGSKVIQSTNVDPQIKVKALQNYMRHLKDLKNAQKFNNWDPGKTPLIEGIDFSYGRYDWHLNPDGTITTDLPF